MHYLHNLQAPEEAHFEPGAADIRVEWCFPSNPKLRFHDSRGFESGDVAQKDDVQVFIRGRRGSEIQLDDSVHLAWCVPFSYDETP